MYVPPNRAMAAMGVKFGQWGMSRRSAPKRIKPPTRAILGEMFFKFIMM